VTERHPPRPRPHQPPEPPRVVTSATNATVKHVRALEMRKVRERERQFVTEGVRHLREALACGWTVRTLICQSDSIRRPAVAELVATCTARGSECLEVTGELMARITHRENAETVIGVIEQRWLTPADIPATPDTVWVALEEVRDPGNLGTIMRTADAVGAQGVLLVGATCDPFSTEAVRASMGSFARIAVARASREAFLAWRAGWPGRVVGTHLETTADFRSTAYDRPLMLLMGNEQAGLSDALLPACDALVKIPMAGGADSLNLAVATGLMLFEAARGRLRLP
jgi:TrmH family RNA methyltransferase